MNISKIKSKVREIFIKTGNEHLYETLCHIKTKKKRRMSDEEYIKYRFRSDTGCELNLDNPQKFSDKVCYLKLHNRNPLLTKCSDKVKVREYVKECGYENILNVQIGVYDDAGDIDFDNIESPCFIKCNHTSGINIIYDRDKPFDKAAFIKKFNNALKDNYYWYSREWNYKNIEPKIVVERILKDSNGNFPIDYRFFCFNGKPEFVYISEGACTNEGKHAINEIWNIFDMKLNQMDFSMEKPNDISFLPTAPQNWDSMIKIAEDLSKPFQHCRVDLYNIDGRIVFGEITFYHCGGNFTISPEEMDYEIGKMLDISNMNNY